MISDADLLSHIDFLVARAENSGDDITSQAVVLLAHAIALDLHALELVGKLTRTPTPTGANRVLDTNFVVSASDPAEVRYNINLSAQSPVLGTGPASAQVRLLLDGVVVDEAYVEKEQLLGIVSMGDKITQRQSIGCWVPAGSTVQLAKTLVANGAASIVSCFELVWS